LTNIALVLLDQLRADVVGAYGSVVCRTPALDHLADDGMRFDRAYTPIGICSPARASLISGKYPHRHGVLNNVHGPDRLQDDLRPGELSFPTLLRAAGWSTAYTGKWHISAEHGATSQGFEMVGAGDAVVEEVAAERAALGLPVDPVFNVEMTTRYPPLSHRSTRPPHPFPLLGRETHDLDHTPQGFHLRRCIELLDRCAQRSQPFFIVLSFLGPHWPYVLPEPWWSMYAPESIPPWPNFEDDFTGKPGPPRRALQHFGVEGWTWQDWAPVAAAYFGSVTMHDALIGRFLDALREHGLDGDTLVMVTADHGDLCGSHRQFNKAPLMYEEVYRIPLLARWPGVVPAGSACDAYASSLDLAATFLAAAGLEIPPEMADSRSLLPLLRGETPPDWRDCWVSEFHGDEFGLYSQRMLVAGRDKLVYNPHDVDELYDLHADPYELCNLSARAEAAALRDDLESRLYQWMVQTADPLAQLGYGVLA
jgi:arylsulfatase A-like enzyme